MTPLKTLVNNALRLTFNRMIDGETREWPPKCLVFTYQPQRPKITGNTCNTSDVATQKRNERR